jgi:hypothetical protein
VLGVLSSAIHAAWALAAGSRLGIDGTPRYNKGACFETFPFPDALPALRAKIAELADQIDHHRKSALARDKKVGITLMYNVVDRLRSGAQLSKTEREVHELAACGTLRDMHDELDHLVAEAYGWPWPEPAATILDRLVALHGKRVEEEAAGTVRWLRPEYQRPRFGKQLDTGAEATEAEGQAVTAPPLPWPWDAVGQITALHALAAAGPITVDQATLRFTGAKRELVARHLETLAILGEVRAVGDACEAPPVAAG